MARSTGPALAIGAITVANNVILGDEGWTEQRRPLVGTGLVALALLGVERLSPALAEGIAWLGVVTVLFVRTGGQPSPAERVNELLLEGS